MKKLLILMSLTIVLFGCSKSSNALLVGMTNVEWIQDDDYKLFLNDEGEISYYSSSAGNPYHNFDLCEKYTYDSSNKEFMFNSDACQMKFIQINEAKDELILLVDNEEITFTKKKY